MQPLVLSDIDVLLSFPSDVGRLPCFPARTASKQGCNFPAEEKGHYSSELTLWELQ